MEMKLHPGLMFLGDHEIVEHEACSGWTNIVQTDKSWSKVRDLMKSDHGLMLTVADNGLNLNQQAAQVILMHDLK